MKPLLRLLSLLALSCAQADAQSVPALINYQGHLSDAQGQPLPDADYVLSFFIYDAELGGNLVWGPQTFDDGTGNGHRPKVPIVGGFFNVPLGPEDEAGRSLTAAFATTNRWIGIKVGSATAIQPRQRILSAPFAIRSEFAENANSAQTAKSAETAKSVQGNAIVTTPSGFVGIGTTTPQYALDVYASTKDADGSTVNITHEYSRTAGSSSGSDFIRAVNIWKQKYDVPEDAIASGYQIGIAPEVYVADSRFEGIIEDQYAIWARTGMYQIGTKGPRRINNAYGIYVQGLTAEGGTIQNHYGVFQEGAMTKNFFGGLVGLGTSSPQERLHVHGTIMTEGSGPGARIVLKSTAPGGHQYEWYPDSPANGDLSLYDRTAESTRIAVKAGGNVGIGTPNPQTLLDVTGRPLIDGDARHLLYLRDSSPAQRGVGGGASFLGQVRSDGSSANLASIRGYKENDTDGDYGGALLFLTTPNRGSPTERMRVSSAGYVGIGTRSPNYNLEVQGNAGKPGGGPWSTASDARLKANIEPIRGALETLLSLHGVTFEYRDARAIGELSGRQRGMIAQEVEKVVEDWVDEGPDGYKRVTYRGFEALTVEALRELQAEKDREIAALQERNRALESRLANLEQLIPRLAGKAHIDAP